MITIRKSNQALGAEILGVDINKIVSKDNINYINSSWLENEVIFFREQNLDPEDHIRFSEQLGTLDVHVRTDCCRPGYPKIFIVSNIIKNGNPIGAGDAGTIWHSDGCCYEYPSRGSLLYAKLIPMDGTNPMGDTLFSSMTKAFEALDSDLKNKLTKLYAVNSYIKGYSRPRKTGDIPPLSKEQRSKVPNITVPVVRIHPFTGKPCLFVNEGYTTHIEGVSDMESQDILNFLFNHIKKDEFIYRHRWQVGDLLAWDNCATQHCAIMDYSPMLRHMERTTISGTKSIKNNYFN